jgi:hypothetical protein
MSLLFLIASFCYKQIRSQSPALEANQGLVDHQHLQDGRATSVLFLIDPTLM